MIPVLYPATETEFTTNGIGFLSDAISCKVYRAVNGGYELTMQYPVSGVHYADISLRSIIKAKPDKVSDPQALRIYRITKPFKGVVTVYARHLVYDLSGIPVSPFTASGVAAAMVALKNNAVVDCPFEFLTTKSGGGTMTVPAPASLWSRLGGTSGSVLDVYGGEYSYDNYKVTLNTRLGSDNGVIIRYGKNLTDLEQDANCANCYTGVYPYWQLEDELVTLPEKIVHADGNFDYVKILPLDLSEKFETAPTEEQLRTAAENYIENNNIGVPDVSWKVEFVALEDTEEYRGMGVLERISLGDTVTVEFEKLGVNATARAVAVEYDCLLERYDSITLGRLKSNIADTIAEQQKEIEEKPSKSLVEKISDNLAAAITGANGGSVRLLDTNADGEPDTLYIADNPDPAQAVKVWRFNYEGWAASANGYNGPFVMGATFDDGILANLINVVNLFAQNITMTGTFTNTTEAFLEPNQQVIDRLNRHLLDLEFIPDSELAKYDFNSDGRLSGSDIVTARWAALGRGSLANWAGAVKTPVTCTIDLSNPNRALVMSGTDMWGNYRETVVGVDPSTATFAIKKDVDAIIQLSGDGESLYRYVNGEEASYNPRLSTTLVDGVAHEYRTIKRFNYDEPVYTAAVPCGAMPQSGGRNVPHGLRIKQVISCTGVTADGLSLPYCSSSGTRLEISANQTHVVLYSSYDTTVTDVVAILEYTKR